jgi:hypothetical protein
MRLRCCTIDHKDIETLHADNAVSLLCVILLCSYFLAAFRGRKRANLLHLHLVHADEKCLT